LYSSKIGDDSTGIHNPTAIDVLPSEVSMIVKPDLEIANDTNNSITTEIVTYKEICTIKNLELGLKRTKSGVSAGLDGEIKANYTIGKLEKLAEELKSHSFKASPVKKVLIPKPDGGKRPLGISSQKDKIIQATILNLLEPIVENEFLDSSMGFRPNRGTHNALHRIKRRWQNVT